MKTNFKLGKGFSCSGLCFLFKIHSVVPFLVNLNFCFFYRSEDQKTDDGIKYPSMKALEGYEEGSEIITKDAFNNLSTLYLGRVQPNGLCLINSVYLSSKCYPWANPSLKVETLAQIIYKEVSENKHKYIQFVSEVEQTFYNH